jgi:hypothetical protein
MGIDKNVNKGEFDPFSLVSVVKVYYDVCLFVGYGNLVVCWCEKDYQKTCSRVLLNEKDATLLCRLFMVLCNAIVKASLLVPLICWLHPHIAISSTTCMKMACA